MAKQKSSRKGSRLKTVVDVATAGIGLASMAYGAVQEHREKAKPGTGQNQPPRPDLPEMQVVRERQARAGHEVPTDRLPGAATFAARAIRQEAGPVSGRLPVADGDGADTLGRVAGAVGAIGAAVGAAKTLIDLNAASPDTLRSLKKISKKRARKIVAHRPFGRVKDLKKVLPKRVYKVVKDQLTV